MLSLQRFIQSQNKVIISFHTTINYLVNRNAIVWNWPDVKAEDSGGGGDGWGEGEASAIGNDLTLVFYDREIFGGNKHAGAYGNFGTLGPKIRRGGRESDKTAKALRRRLRGREGENGALRLRHGEFIILTMHHNRGILTIKTPFRSYYVYSNFRGDQRKQCFGDFAKYFERAFKL